jgi:hypothetical protein
MNRKHRFYDSIISDAHYMAKTKSHDSPFCCAIIADAALFRNSYMEQRFNPYLIAGWTRSVDEYKPQYSTLSPSDIKIFHTVEEFLKMEDPQRDPPNISRFVREGSEWYIDLPGYVGVLGSKADLQMVSGADTMLDRIAGKNSEVTLQMETYPFAGSDEVSLLRRCDPSVGGGEYILHTFEKKTFNQEMWLCGVTEVVFGYLPDSIFIKRC